jgi:hypothetical protein
VLQLNRSSSDAYVAYGVCSRIFAMPFLGVRFREFGVEFILSLLYEVIHVYQLHMGSNLGNSMPDLV